MELFTLPNLLHFSLIIVCFVFAVILLTEKPKSKKILGFMMVFASGFYFFNAGFLCRPMNYCDFNRPFLLLFFLSIVPFYYFYTKSLTTKIFRWNKNFYIHFSPAIIATISSLIVLNFFGSAGNGRLYYSTIHKFSVIVYFFQVLGYSIAMFVLLKKHTKNIKHFFSYNNVRNNLNWLKFFLLFFIFFSAVDFFFFFAFYLGELYALEITYLSLVIGFFIFIGVFGLRQKEIYPQDNNMDDSVLENSRDKNIFKNVIIIDEKKQPLTDKRAKDIFMELNKLIEDEKLYRNPDLSIFYISKRINVNTKYISHAINSEANSNFCTYINTFRINESKQLLKTKESDNYTLTGIANIVGFHSQPPFNSWFKKITGETPSQYKKKYRGATSVPV